jgi:hypothetical protein
MPGPVDREELDKDQQPVWTEPNFWRRLSYRYSHADETTQLVFPFGLLIGELLLLLVLEAVKHG